MTRGPIRVSTELPDRAFVSQPATTFPPAADAESVITQRLPRGWVPTGRLIDVEVGAP